ncbi:MAG TPA: Fur family transcriptional regulator [Candidatus Sumerlaeota bacterium]|jgi:Fe2+ or Zn2+ uptake regulation protein|nr:MAG: Peroxide operon regulator [candidate division BRC1 bacterium ADurb.Bin183]HOE62634.1 Fur family transcriptional regulator [Candidatus Sumerlaeota bacterium]HRR31053.1 Fur family transcriptional regulator [Candidatus Sumerlaeia bacterium]HON49394.1 Fur family transcriptional regulator [Candidatus Sumerlaeota bacterium]HOR64857.1 Fur family transcriptional regulator [Candidatus Sumerlaeota bacterium]
MERLKNILLEHDLRPSFHRIKVLEYLVSCRTHPTPERIYLDLRAAIPTISRATVYNSLKVFVEKGLACALHADGEEARYDYKDSEHAHFYCVQCGKLIDVDYQCPSLKLKKIGNHQIREAHLSFRGICADCWKEKND